MRKSNFEKNLNKLNYKKYFNKFNLKKLLKTKEFKKKNFSPSFIYENNNKSVYPPDLKDLIRLHYIATTRKVTTILEFGVGYSTIFLADALKYNLENHKSYVLKNLRRSNPFKLFSIDSNKKYLKLFKKTIPKNLIQFVNLSYSSASITTFKDQICGKLDKIPNITPDFIYVDGPSFLDIKGSIDGVSFKDKDRTALNCNLLKIENLLLPGTLILWDGQTNNARFNSSNFKRKWSSKRIEKIDISFSEQIEEPLGYLNKRQINFSKTKAI